MKVLFAGGGTGGHVYPAIALAKALQAQNTSCQVLFVGADGGMETTLVPQEGFCLQTITVSGLSRSNPAAAVRSLWQAGIGVCKARSIIKGFAPDVAVGTGGYVSGPVILAAASLGIPTLIHEQNAYPGLTTRALARFARIVAVSHTDAVARLPKARRVVVTGLPIRSTFYQINRQEARIRLGLSPEALVVLSVGGSGGALRLNQVVCEAAPHLLENDKVVLLQVSGERYYDSVREAARGMRLPAAVQERWLVTRFMRDMPAAIGAADLVISRAGASTLEEITAVGVPAIIVPSPNVTDNHQEHNARALAAQGAAVVILDSLLSKDNLLRTIADVLEDPAKHRAMAEASRLSSHPQATADLIALVNSLC